jgi:hypothetical protein
MFCRNFFYFCVVSLHRSTGIVGNICHNFEECETCPDCEFISTSDENPATEENPANGTSDTSEVTIPAGSDDTSEVTTPTGSDDTSEVTTPVGPPVNMDTLDKLEEEYSKSNSDYILLNKLIDMCKTLGQWDRYQFYNSERERLEKENTEGTSEWYRKEAEMAVSAGNVLEAKKILTEALDKYPSDEEIRKALNQITSALQEPY